MTTIVQIAKQLKLSPKVARRKLRTAKVRRPSAGWVFNTPAQVKAVKKALA